MYKRVHTVFFNKQIWLNFYLLFSVILLRAMDDQSMIATQQCLQEQLLIQIPHTNSLLDTNPTLQHVPITLGNLLLPLKDIKFVTTQSARSVEKQGVEIFLEGYAKIPIGNRYLMVYPHEIINADGSRRCHTNQGFSCANNTVSVYSDYMLSQQGRVQVVITPVDAWYTPETGGTVKISQAPYNYLFAQKCSLGSTLGANSLTLPLTKVDLSGNYLTSWHDIQVNLLAHMPQLKTFIVDNNPLHGCCALDHTTLETLQAAHTNTVGFNLKLPAAKVIDLSYAKITRYNAKNIESLNKARICLSNNPLESFNSVNNRGLQFDLRGTAISIEDVRKHLTPMLQFRSRVNTYLYNVAEFVRTGALNIGLLAVLSAVANNTLHSCKSSQYRSYMLMSGLLPAALLVSGSVSFGQKLLGVATTPCIVTCDDGYLYASGTIEKTDEELATKRSLWRGNSSQLVAGCDK